MIDPRFSKCNNVLRNTNLPVPRTCSICGIGICQNPNAVSNLITTKDGEATKEPWFDDVSRAKHYNVHPSNIESINLVRCLNFNMGCSLKYVMRRHGKEYQRSLQSALYYLEDQHVTGNCMILNYAIFRLLDDYTQAEPVRQAATFYRMFSAYLNMPTTNNFELMVGSLNRLLEGNL